MLQIDLLNFEDARYERKFVVGGIGPKEVEKIIQFNPAMFSEIFYERNVNNIYFDSINQDSYFGNVDGDFQRLKIRVRWYGKMGGLIENPVLEVKIKKGEIGKKLSFPLKKFILDRNFSQEYFKKEVLDKSKLPKWILEKLRRYNFSLLNHYKRKYFISSDKRYRITLDRDLIFFEIKNRNNLFMNKIKEEKIVLELKYDRKDDERAKEVTQKLLFRLSKNSKFVSGIDLLGV
jgi:SPX domain protein involved in polyphosphate accumulation